MQYFPCRKASKQRFVLSNFWLFSQNNQPTLDWKFRNDWAKRLQKLPRKINVSLSESWLKKMNGSCLINQLRSCMLPYTSQIAEEAFFSVTFFRTWFYDSQFSKIKFNCSNWGRPRNIAVVECYVSKVPAFIPQLNQLHSGCY